MGIGFQWIKMHWLFSIYSEQGLEILRFFPWWQILFHSRLISMSRPQRRKTQLGSCVGLVEHESDPKQGCFWTTRCEISEKPSVSETPNSDIWDLFFNFVFLLFAELNFFFP